MLRRQLTLLALLISATMTTIDAQVKPEPQEISGKVKWVYDLEDGRQQSLATDKPMFVVFRCER